LNKKREAKDPKVESVKDKRTESLMLRLVSNLVSKDFWPVLDQDLANQEGLMDIFWKADSLSFMLRRFNQEKNDLFIINILFHFKFIHETSTKSINLYLLRLSDLIHKLYNQKLFLLIL